jgi:hypothetical protein
MYMLAILDELVAAATGGRTMSDLVGTSEWVRPKAWKMDWELRQGDEILATMSSPRMFGTTVNATMDGTTYVMRKGGLRRPGAVMRRLGEDGDIATLELDSIGKGIITMGPSRYQWEREGTSDKWTLSQEGRGAIFELSRDSRSKYPTGRVVVDIADPNLGPLLLLTWFLASTSEC